MFTHLSSLNTCLPQNPGGLDGFRPGQLAIFVGPAMSGKTMMALNFAHHIASTEEEKILYFSTSETPAALHEVVQKIGTDRPYNSNLINFYEARRMSSDPIEFIHEEIRATAAGVVIIDSLAEFENLVPTDPGLLDTMGGYAALRAKIIKRLKKIAQDEGVFLVILAQPRRTLTGTNSRKIDATMTHLSDYIFSLARITENNELEIRVIKNRHGPSGDLQCFFDPKTMIISDGATPSRITAKVVFVDEVDGLLF